MLQGTPFGQLANLLRFLPFGGNVSLPSPQSGISPNFLAFMQPEIMVHVLHFVMAVIAAALGIHFTVCPNWRRWYCLTPA
jgi:hypothetical protein